MNTDQRNDREIVCDGMPTMMGCSSQVKAGRTNWSKAGTKRNGWYVTPATDDIYGKVTVPEFLCYFCPSCAVIVKEQEKQQCKLSADGWCFTHSTDAGPVYCKPKP